MIAHFSNVMKRSNKINKNTDNNSKTSQAKRRMDEEVRYQVKKIATRTGAVWEEKAWARNENEGTQCKALITGGRAWARREREEKRLKKKMFPLNHQYSGQITLELDAKNDKCFRQNNQQTSEARSINSWLRSNILGEKPESILTLSKFKPLFLKRWQPGGFFQS